MKDRNKYTRRVEEREGWVIIYRLNKNKSRAVAVNYYADNGDESDDKQWQWVDNTYKAIAKKFGAMEAVIIVNDLRDIEWQKKR
jgi:hypothetical protein|tara:strand:- start:20 stop:271 length:252 start_codon:yes stop_codon:yes gene_type:complete